MNSGEGSRRGKKRDSVAGNQNYFPSELSWKGSENHKNPGRKAYKPQ